MTERAKRMAAHNAAYAIEKEFDSDHNYDWSFPGLYGSTIYPGFIEVRFNGITEEEARKLLRFARDSGMLSALAERTREEDQP